MAICERDCNACMLYAVCKGCSFCEAAICKRDCNRCFALCPLRNPLDMEGDPISYLQHYFLPEQFFLRRTLKRKLPMIIPIIPDRLTDTLDVGSFIALHAQNMFSLNGENIAPIYRKKGFKKVLNLPEETHGILEFYVKDRTLEGFWDNRKRIYQQLREQDLYAMIAPNFSVYEDAPRSDHLYNMKRGIIVYNEMIEHGLPAIPDVSWYNRGDLDRWIKAINESSIGVIAYSFQTVGADKAANTWISYLTGFQYLVKHISEDVQIIIAGVASPKRLKYIFESCQNPLSILNQSAFVKSRRGLVLNKNISENQMDKNEIFLSNLEFYKNQYELLQKERVKNAEIKKRKQPCQSK